MLRSLVVGDVGRTRLAGASCRYALAGRLRTGPGGLDFRPGWRGTPRRRALLRAYGGKPGSHAVRLCGRLAILGYAFARACCRPRTRG